MNPTLENLNPIAKIGIERFLNYESSVVKKYLSMLKPYFNVDSKYVIRKLKIIAIPFLHENWVRQRDLKTGDCMPPNQDVNAPDLYIPLMAFITYILLIAFTMVTTLKFTPDILERTATQGIMVCVLEVALLKLFLFLFNFQSIPILDKISYSGYKYVGAIPPLIAGLLLGNFVFYIICIVFSLLNAIFMMNIYKRVIPKPLERINQLKRQIILFGIGVLQFFLLLFLCYINFSNSQVKIMYIQQ